MLQPDSARGIASTLLESQKNKKPTNKRLAPIKATEIKNKGLVSPSPMGGTMSDGKAGDFMDQRTKDRAFSS